ncbi:MAG: stage III sporulation protein AD [Clostridia bacterium]|nr:stage III sporulation protein AD [Oscillospiraceae bacterium]MBQ7960482.1 stage III sporulation protein AD [Clostridia bacterium]
MDIFKVAALGLAAAVLAVFVKNWRAEIALQISLIAVIIIFFTVLPYLKTVLEMLRDISNRTGVDSKYISLVLKVIGIAYVTQFGAELCRDAGEGAVASKIEFGGKVMIVALSMPVMYSFLEIVEKIIRFG